MKTKIGILLPRSDMFPTLGKDMLDGLRLGLGPEHDNTAIDFCIESVGLAADENLIQAAQKMLLQDTPDLTVSFCSKLILDQLVTVFDSYKKPLIYTGLGGNVIKKSHLSPYVGYHSLNLWQSNYAAGKYASETYGKKAVVAASFYDGGYQHTQAMVEGFTDHGGEITEYYVGPMDYKNEDYQALIDKLSNTDADVAFLLFSFKEGQKVLEAIAKSEVNGKLPFLAIPTLTDETINTSNHQISQLSSVASWAFDDENPAMLGFVKSLEQQHHIPPNIIHLLGYELGLVVGHYLSDGGQIPQKVGEALKDLKLESPRGTLGYNNLVESQVDSFKVRAFNYNEVRYHNSVIGSLSTSCTDNLYERYEEQAYAGWQNPYICT